MSMQSGPDLFDVARLDITKTTHGHVTHNITQHSTTEMNTKNRHATSDATVELQQLRRSQRVQRPVQRLDM